MKFCWAIVVTVAWSSSLVAAIYQSTNDEGHSTFSDTPSPSAVLIKLERTNLMPAIQPAPPVLPSPIEPAPTPVYNKLTIISPAPNSIIPNGPGNFEVTVEIEPPLRQSDSVQLTLDSHVYRSGKQLSFALTGVPRGSHELQVSVLDSAGVSLIQSDPVTIYVYRPSKK